MVKISFGYENPIRSRFSEEFFKELPTNPGVYFFLDAHLQPLYIGKADNLKKRLMSYRLAKPGHSPENILEMIEHAEEIKWELHESGAQALKREGDLIRVVQPPFNIAGTDPIPYLYWGIRVFDAKKGEESTKIDFRLSRTLVTETGFEGFGCFRQRGKVKAGYSALMRLLYASTCDRLRFHLPSKICRTSPPYVYSARIPNEWVRPLETFLRGKDATLLKKIMQRLLNRTNIAPPMYAPLQRDLFALQEFFKAGPKDTRRIARLAGVRKGPILQSQMDEFLKQNVLKPEFLT
jgi:excinuclease UvrABC nuclease subunit